MEKNSDIDQWFSDIAINLKNKWICFCQYEEVILNGRRRGDTETNSSTSGRSTGAEEVKREG